MITRKINITRLKGGGGISRIHKLRVLHTGPTRFPGITRTSFKGGNMDYKDYNDYNYCKDYND